MKRVFSEIAKVDELAVRYDRDRALVDRVRPSHAPDGRRLRYTAAVYPAEAFPVISVREAHGYVQSLEPSAAGGRSFPDRTVVRTTSRAVVSGFPRSAYVGTSGFLSAFGASSTDGEPHPVAFPHWWHAHVGALFAWAGRLYEELDYSGDVIGELELDGPENLAVLFNPYTDAGEHTSLEDGVRVQVVTTAAALATGSAEPTLLLTADACAAFNWSASLDDIRQALDR